METDPAACLARRPVSNRTVRVPNVPLSITASAAVISGPSKGHSPVHRWAPRWAAQFGRSGALRIDRSSIETHGSAWSGRSGGHYRGPVPALVDHSWCHSLMLSEPRASAALLTSVLLFFRALLVV